MKEYKNIPKGIYINVNEKYKPIMVYLDVLEKLEKAQQLWKERRRRKND